VNGDDVTGFLSRWSRRKLGKEAPAGAPADVPAAQPAAAPAGEEQPAPEPLPPVESLTPESDFKPFMRPEVDPGVKQAAMKQLFKDPQFNVMDGLDIYIGDYSQPDPIPPEMLARLNQMSHLGVREREPDAEAAKEGGKAVAGEADGKDHESAPGPATVPPLTVAAPTDAQPENPGAGTRSAPLPEAEKTSR
jgi:hypothetical protein